MIRNFVSILMTYGVIHHCRLSQLVDMTDTAETTVVMITSSEYFQLVHDNLSFNAFSKFLVIQII